MTIVDNTSHERVVQVHYNELNLKTLLLADAAAKSGFPIDGDKVTVEVIFSETGPDSGNRRERHAVVRLRQDLLPREPSF